MKIFYDHQIFTAQKYGGISRYFYELYSHISLLPDIEPKLLVLYSENEYYSKINVRKKLIPEKNFPGKQTFIRLMNTYHSRYHLFKNQFDVFHPTYYDPYFLKYLKGKPFVLTIYDMIHEFFPEQFPNKDPTMLNKKVLATKADFIITISHNTKKDVIETYSIDEDRVFVIYLGNSLSSSEKPESLNLPSQYVLYVGDRQIYKNFYRFLIAVAPILHDNPSLYIVCAGGKNFSSEEISLFNKQGILSRVLRYGDSLIKATTIY